MTNPQNRRLTPRLVAEFAQEMRVEPSDYCRLLDTFVERNEERLAELREAVSRRDAETAHRVVHSVKGTSSTLRLNWMAETAARLEDALRQGDFGDCERDIKKLETALDDIKTDAKTVREAIVG